MARRSARKSPAGSSRPPTAAPPATDREKIIAALLNLLAAKRIEQIGFADIAEAARVSLAQLCHVQTADGANEIYREGNSRYVAIKYSVRGRDLGSAVEAAMRAVSQHVTLPDGYRIDWAGEYASQQRSQRRLMIVVPITVLIILIIL